MVLSKAKVLLLAVAMGVSIASARQDADNTKANKEPQNKMATADQAKNSKTDRRLMKEIRRAIVKDKSLSTSAHNVKVIASGGRVTLTGPVKSDDEKKAVEQKASEVAGSGNVTNEMTVAGSNQ
jgi:hyperosmotically inducible periplasmic protein